MKLICKIMPVFIFFSNITIAQQWAKHLAPKANFYEIQKAFNDYWKNKQAPYNAVNTEDGEYAHFKRWEEFTENRLDSNGVFPAQQLYKEYQKQKKLKKAVTNTTANWQYIGSPSVPTGFIPGAGRLNTLEFDPSNSNTMWVGAANGGLWKSTNGGTSWTTNTDFLPNISIADIAINPSNTNEMYIATGDNYGYGESSSFFGGTYSAGLLKSIDGGITWNATGLATAIQSEAMIYKICLLPNNPQVLLVGNKDGILRTTDGGLTWNLVYSSSGFLTNIYDFEIDPVNPNIIYSVSVDHFLKSTDAGLTWVEGFNFGSIGRTDIEISPANPSKIYIFAEPGTLYVSNNAGLSFTSIDVDIILNTSTGFFTFYMMALGVSPTNANEIYVGGLNLAKSTDGGLTWSLTSSWSGSAGVNFVHADNRFIEFLPNSGTTLFACNDGGIFKSTNNGTNWADISSNLNIAQCYRLATAQSLPSNYVVGLQDNGTIFSNTGTYKTVKGGDGMDNVVDNQNANRIIVSSQNGNFVSTTDNFTTINYITPSGFSGKFITPIILDPQNQNIVYTSWGEIYKSIDFGNTWTQLTTDNGGYGILAIAPSNSNYLYAADAATLKRTTNGGASWTDLSSGLPNSSYSSVTSIAISNNNPNKLWITLSGFVAGQKVFISNDGGSTWVNFSGTLPNITCNTIVYQPNSNDELYLGTDFGVYYRNNTMSDWVPFQTNLPNVIVKELEIVPSINCIRAATYGRGVWQSTLNNPISVGIKNNSKNISSVTIFPNPTKDVLQLSILENKMENCEIIIKNILGESVYQTTNIKQQNSINISHLQSGTYFVSFLKDNEVLSTQKMIKL